MVFLRVKIIEKCPFFRRDSTNFPAEVKALRWFYVRFKAMGHVCLAHARCWSCKRFDAYFKVKFGLGPVSYSLYSPQRRFIPGFNLSLGKKGKTQTTQTLAVVIFTWPIQIPIFRYHLFQLAVIPKLNKTQPFTYLPRSCHEVPLKEPFWCGLGCV